MQRTGRVQVVDAPGSDLNWVGDEAALTSDCRRWGRDELGLSANAAIQTDDADGGRAVEAAGLAESSGKEQLAG
jgi:hypothetical protein